MKVAIVSQGHKNFFLEKKILVDSIPNSFLNFPSDNQDKNLDVMITTETTQISDSYNEQFSTSFLKTDMKKLIKRQNKMSNQRLKKNMRQLLYVIYYKYNNWRQKYGSN